MIQTLHFVNKIIDFLSPKYARGIWWKSEETKNNWYNSFTWHVLVYKQEAHGLQRSPEKSIQFNEYIWEKLWLYIF